MDDWLYFEYTLLCFFPNWCFVLLLNWNAILSISAHQSPSLKCSIKSCSLVTIVTQLIAMPIYFNSSNFGLHLWHQLISGLFTSLISPCDFTIFAFFFFFFFLQVCSVPSPGINLLGLFRDFLNSPQLPHARLWAKALVYHFLSSRDLSISLFIEVGRKRLSEVSEM